MAAYNDARVRPGNTKSVDPSGRYVVYWCNLYRRLRANHALDRAAEWARRLSKPLVVFEGLILRYPWATARVHRFILEGMRDSAADAARLGLNHWMFVETPDRPGDGPLLDVAADACVVVTDDYPQFVAPPQIRRIGPRLGVALELVDGNSMVPLARLGNPAAAATHLRPRIHKEFAIAWGHRAAAEPALSRVARTVVDPPFEPWVPPADLGRFVAGLPTIDQAVRPPRGAEGGSGAARAQLAAFVRDKLPRYAEGRNQPDDPARSGQSGLSWALHFGHVGAQEVCEAVLGEDWDPSQINPRARYKDDFFARDPNVNAYLDELVTWRDLGLHWNYCRTVALGDRGGDAVTHDPAGGTPAFNFARYDFSPVSDAGTLAEVLPEWALATLGKHAGDRRTHLYSLEQLENADTHDEVWNAAQLQLVRAGRIHNYMRMLWGKKVLEWSETPEAAYRVLEHLNNKYHIDGRDCNSYSGLHWVFGLFDRPWPPERPVFGVVRYMSSENTAKKFDLSGYFGYVRGLADDAPPPAAVGRPRGKAK